MAKERFSKLQKWILKKLRSSKGGSINTDDIYAKFFGQKTEAARVSLSRSLKRLKERGLIEYNLYYNKRIKLVG